MKTIVLDTNIIIEDPTCYLKFGDDDIVIPMPVLEELDGLKKGQGIEGANAREFVREIDRLSGSESWEGGVPLGEGLGRLFIESNSGNEKFWSIVQDQCKPDNRILGVCWFLAEYGRNPTLITQDVNLRLKAKALGISAEGYTLGKDKRQDTNYGGVRCLEDVPRGIITDLYKSSAGINPIILDIEPIPNEYFILKNESASVLATYCKADNSIRKITTKDAYNITPRNAEQFFAVHALSDPSIQLVTITGRAGTGKTLLALAAALEQRSSFRQIMLARPIVTMGNDIGFLPGDLKEKLGPYMQPLFDNLAVIKDNTGDRSAAGEAIGKMIEDEKLVVEPLAYIRGRSLVRKFVIIDEAQNLTPHEVKTIVTRAGEGTKVVFTGDVEQIDKAGIDSVSNGLSYLADRFRGQQIYAHVNLEKGERSELSELASKLL